MFRVSSQREVPSRYGLQPDGWFTLMSPDPEVAPSSLYCHHFGSWNEQFLLHPSILGEPIEIPGDRLLNEDMSRIPRFCYPHTGKISAHLHTPNTCGVGARRHHNFPEIRKNIYIFALSVIFPNNQVATCPLIEAHASPGFPLPETT